MPILSSLAIQCFAIEEKYKSSSELSGQHDEVVVAQIRSIREKRLFGALRMDVEAKIGTQFDGVYSHETGCMLASLELKELERLHVLRAEMVSTDRRATVDHEQNSMCRELVSFADASRIASIVCSSFARKKKGSANSFEAALSKCCAQG